METSLTFHFYGDLTRFLPKKIHKKKVIVYKVKGHPAIKDSIEALGIPHTEIGNMMISGREVGFYYHVQDGDCIDIYPHGLRKFSAQRFILDVHLGKLARHLRLLGFNSLYQTDFQDAQMLRIIKKEKRILLTRDVGLLKNTAVRQGYFVRSTDSEEQMKEMMTKFSLAKKIKPFSLCIECNGRIKPVTKSKIEDQLLPRVRKYYDEFYRCQSCHKIYWQGSHYAKLFKVVQRLRKLE